MAIYFTPPATGSKVEVSSDGGTTFTRLQNVTSIDISGGDRTETTTETLDNDPVVSVGSAQPKDISIGVNATPGASGYRILTKSYRDAERVLVRMETAKKRVIDNATATRTLSVAATGVVTGVNTRFNSAPWQPGMAIVLDNTTFVIESITSDTAMTVSRPDGMAITQVSADDDWELWEYGLRYQFNAEVLNGGNASFATGGSPVTDTFSLKSTSVLGDPTLVVTTV